MYRFSDQHGRVIYVGKAKSLRSRLTSYFADVASLHPRTRQMVTTAAKVEWTVVNTEVEALQLEYNWIKEFDPRFNVRYRDDKSYPVLAVTLNEEFPTADGVSGPAPERCPLFRAVLACLGHPGDPGFADPGVPGHLLGWSIQAAQPNRSSVSAGLYRQVLGAVHRAGQRRAASPDRDGLLRLPVR